MSHPLPSVFNCSNDMALAANVDQYIPPKRIQQRETALASLSCCWDGTRVAGPWGWSRAMMKRYIQMGVDQSLLPSLQWIDQVRQLSSRQYACQYIQNLLSDIDDSRLIGSDMRFCHTVEDARIWVEANGIDTAIYKLPWSSSGRGVFVSQDTDARDMERLSGFVRSQGGFAMDRYYTGKTLDFAMEFFVGNGGITEFLGYSVFHASDGGTYGYNVVASQQQLLRQIDVDPELLQRLIDYHVIHLPSTFYRGPIGIDMIKVIGHDGRACVHPCIEINLRMNMGILALLLYERYGDSCPIFLTPPDGRTFYAAVEDGRLQIKVRRGI